jgi:hypothetical protein
MDPLSTCDVSPRPKDAYYKLILAAGPVRSGKTDALFELAGTIGHV